MKFQTPTIGGVRKVIRTDNNVTVGTTIAEVGSNTITLAQLAQIITQIQSQQQNNGGGNVGGGAEASIVLGPGLSGGGVLVGNVPIRLTAPIPWGLDDGGGGGDGDPGPPGTAGAAGAAGAPGLPGGVGPAGPAIYLEAEPGEDGLWAIPGPTGPQGNPGTNGATGGQGPIGPAIFIFAEDGGDGDIGPPGQAGAQGVAGTGTSTPVPGTIPDLMNWWSSDGILGTSGKPIYRLQERTPWVTGVLATNASVNRVNTPTIDTSQLNSLNVLKWPVSGGSTAYNIVNQCQITSAATFFIVFKPTSAVAGAAQTFVGGTASGLAFYMNTASGGTALALVKTASAIIGVATTSWTTGSWFQANATYTAATGAYAFRQGRAAAGSGTGATLAESGITQFIGGDTGSSTNTLNTTSLAELIIYNRVLSGAEITSVENYLNTKWGV